MSYLNENNSITIGRSIYDAITKTFRYEKLTEKEIEEQTQKL